MVRVCIKHRSGWKPTMTPIEEGAVAVDNDTISMTLRRIVDEPLGLMVMLPQGRSRQLVVQSVRENSVAASWNAMTACEGRDLRKGDRIIEVNGCSENDSMLQQFREKLVLKLVIRRR